MNVEFAETGPAEPSNSQALTIGELDDKVATQWLTGGFESVNWDEVSNVAQRFWLQNEAVNRALQRLGWPPPKFLDSDLWPKILGQLKGRTVDEAKDDIEAAITLHYQGTAFDALRDEWQTRNSTRLRQSILAKVCEAHALGFYDLTVPTMFAQIEGIIVDHLAPSHHLDTKRWQKIVNALTTSADFPGDQTAQKFFLECVLQQFRRPSVIPQGPSRHAILHGADLNYGTEENSLKLILTMEYLSRILDRLVVHQDGVVHRTRCLLLEPLSDQYELKRLLLGGKLWLASTQNACPACSNGDEVRLLQNDATNLFEDIV